MQIMAIHSFPSSMSLVLLFQSWHGSGGRNLTSMRTGRQQNAVLQTHLSLCGTAFVSSANQII